MEEIAYKTKEEVLSQANTAFHKTLREIIPANEVGQVEKMLIRYDCRRKGFLGDLVEQFIFGKKIDGRPEADFMIAGVELKTTPIKKHSQKTYIAKERLVFSMIDYDRIVAEDWESSSFLKKNKMLLLMLYLYTKELNLLDYEFKFIHLLELLNDISEQDINQIKNDWEFIVNKIRRGDAHLLSEGDTFYLGACTKAKNSTVVREQPKSRNLAKPRAFSLKQTYLNYIIQTKLLGRKYDADSIYADTKKNKSIESVIHDKFAKYIGKTNKEIETMIAWQSKSKPKHYKRLLVNRILSKKGYNHIEELDKANVTLKVITLENNGALKESLSFPAFDYKDLMLQEWYDENNEQMADFHAQLEMRKFLFVIFRKKSKNDEIILEKIKFWNFPMNDLSEAERVFDKTIQSIKDGKYNELPKMKDSQVAHVRPHGKNGNDKITTPQGTREIKRSFWINAKYIQKFLI